MNEIFVQLLDELEERHDLAGVEQGAGGLWATVGLEIECSNPGCETGTGILKMRFSIDTAGLAGQFRAQMLHLSQELGEIAAMAADQLLRSGWDIHLLLCPACQGEVPEDPGIWGAGPDPAGLV